MMAIPMPLPPYVISTSAFLCERVLEEVDHVLSAIRIVEVIHVADPPVGAPPGAVPLIQVYCLAIIKTIPGHHEEHQVEYKMINTKGVMSSVGIEKTTFATIAPFGDDVPGGMTSALRFNLAVSNYGTCYVCIFLDGEELIRVPFTLKRLEPSSE